MINTTLERIILTVLTAGRMKVIYSVTPSWFWQLNVCVYKII